MRVSHIVSGGQTGVDRAALDAAMEVGLGVGGWCPRGRRAEDGVIDAKYPLQETPRAAYAQRTAWNVRDSDGTLVLQYQDPSPGTSLTIEEALRREKPVLVFDLTGVENREAIVDWIAASGINVLNIAGPRESESPGIYKATRTMLMGLFARLT